VKGGLWFPVPVDGANRAREEGMQVLAVFTALCLLRFEAPSDYKDGFYASQARVASKCGLSREKVGRWILVLERMKLVTILKPHGTDCFDPDKNKWKYCIPELRELRNVTDGSNGTSQTSVTPKAPRNVTQKQESSTPQRRRKDSWRRRKKRAGAPADGAGAGTRGGKPRSTGQQPPDPQETGITHWDKLLASGKFQEFATDVRRSLKEAQERGERIQPNWGKGKAAAILERLVAEGEVS
jgi:hypothetical protein